MLKYWHLVDWHREVTGTGRHRQRSVPRSDSEKVKIKAVVPVSCLRWRRQQMESLAIVDWIRARGTFASSPEAPSTCYWWWQSDYRRSVCLTNESRRSPTCQTAREADFL